jgi:membrane fusion protein (multidrug efflux system)
MSPSEVMRRRPFVGLALSIALAAIAGGGCHPKGAAAESKPKETKIKVDTAAAVEQEVPQEIALTGVLEANQRTDLTANATGRVNRLFVELGQIVAAGAPIAKLDARSAALTQQEAAANAATSAEQLASAQRDCERFKALFDLGAISQAEYDHTTVQCKTGASSELAAQARAAQASQTVNDSTIRAPFAGRIADRMIHVGDYVHPDTKVVTLLSDDPLRLRLTVPEPDIFAVKQGITVRFDTLGVQNRSFQGVVKFIGGEVRAQTRDVVVEAMVDNHDGALLPGMFVTAHLAIGQTKLPVIPKNAIVVRDSGQSVFVVATGRLQQRVVQPGAEIGDNVAITDGLKSGEVVVVNPTSAAVDGALVE